MNHDKEMVSVRIPKSMNQKLTEYVKVIGITKNAFILNLIKQEMEKYQYGSGIPRKGRD